jgi:flagellar hook protein FlgE
MNKNEGYMWFIFIVMIFVMINVFMPNVYASDFQNACSHNIAIDGKGYLIVKRKHESQLFYVKHYSLAYQTTNIFFFPFDKKEPSFEPIMYVLSSNRDLHLQGWRLEKTGGVIGNMTDLSCDHFFVNEKTKRITLTNYLENPENLESGVSLFPFDDIEFSWKLLGYNTLSFSNTIDIYVSSMWWFDNSRPREYILELTIYFDKYTNQQNERVFTITCDPAYDNVEPRDGLIDTGLLTFGEDNKLVNVTLKNGDCKTSNACIFSLKEIDPEADQEIELDMTSNTKLWNEPSVNVYKSSNFLGTPRKMKIQSDGIIYGEYSNTEERIPIFQLAAADFPYTSGLNEYYEQTFLETVTSGQANVSTPVNDGLGSITATTDCYDVIREPCDLVVQLGHIPKKLIPGKRYQIQSHIKNAGKGYGSSYYFLSDINSDLDADIEWFICTDKDCSIASNWIYQQAGPVLYYTPEFGQTQIRASFNGEVPCDECNVSNNFSQFEVFVEENLPDLTVKDIWWDFEAYEHEQPVTFIARIENNAHGTSAQSFDVHFIVDKGKPSERDLGTVLVDDDILSVQQPLFPNHGFENGFKNWTVLSGTASVESHLDLDTYNVFTGYHVNNMKIQGNGYFILKDTQFNELLFTRCIQIKPSYDGFFRDPNGYMLQGWKKDADSDEYIQELMPIQLEKSILTLPPVPTTKITLRFNLDSTVSGNPKSLSNCWNGMAILEEKRIDKASYHHSNAIDIIDSKGQLHLIHFYFQKNSANEWEYIITCNPNDLPHRTYTAQDGLLASGFLFVDDPDSGYITRMTCNNETIPDIGKEFCSFYVVFLGQTDSVTKVDLDFGIKETDTLPKSSILASTSVNMYNHRNGFVKGELTGFSFYYFDSIMGFYSCGRSQSIGYKLALSEFENPDALEKVGGQFYKQTPHSGTIRINPPKTVGLGEIDINNYVYHDLRYFLEEQFNSKAGNANYASLYGSDTVLKSPIFIAKGNIIEFLTQNFGPAEKLMLLRSASDNRILAEINCREKSSITLSFNNSYDEFFIVKDINKNIEYLTRSGIFHIDQKGFLADPDGMVARGWKLNPSSGERYEPVTNINLDFMYTAKPVQTKKMKVILNLDSTSEPSGPLTERLYTQWNPGNPNGHYLSDEAYGFSITTIAYDKYGFSHDIYMYFNKRIDYTYEFIVTCNPEEDKRNCINHNGIKGLLAEGTLTFSNGWQINTMTLNGTDRPEMNHPYFIFTANFNDDRNESMNIELDFGFQFVWNEDQYDTKLDQLHTTMFASSFVMIKNIQDGFPGGKLIKSDVTEYGIIRGLYSDGQELQLYQFILAHSIVLDKKRSKTKRTFSDDIFVGPPGEGMPYIIYYDGNSVWKKPSWDVYQLDISSYNDIPVYLEFKMKEPIYSLLELEAANNIFKIDNVGISGGELSTVVSVVNSFDKWAPTEGKHTITAHVDCKNEIQEINEDNNFMTVQIGNFGNISGTVTTSVTGYTAHISGAAVRLLGTDFTAISDESGHYTFNNIPEGSYTVVVAAPYFQSAKNVVDVLSDNDVSAPMNMTVLQQSDIEAIIRKYDPSGDGKIGLEEAIHALKELVKHLED